MIKNWLLKVKLKTYKISNFCSNEYGQSYIERQQRSPQCGTTSWAEGDQRTRQVVAESSRWLADEHRRGRWPRLGKDQDREDGIAPIIIVQRAAWRRGRDTLFSTSEEQILRIQHPQLQEWHQRYKRIQRYVQHRRRFAQRTDGWGGWRFELKPIRRGNDQQ